MSRAIALAAVVVSLLVAITGAARLVDAEPDFASNGARLQGHPATSTPVAAPTKAADPLDGDPLDGDAGRDEPLDGSLARVDPDAPDDQAHFEILRSGRPDTLPQSAVAYDDDPDTVWSPEGTGDDVWLWLDLGEERRVRAVRWLARGGGAVDVSISRDRRRWQEIERVDVAPGWQGVTPREDARYVRLTLRPDETGSVPEIAEAAVYGKSDGSVSTEQKAKQDRKKSDKKKSSDSGGKDKNKNKNKAGSRDRDANGKTKSGGSGRANGQNEIAAEAGETNCEGDRGRCRSREGRVNIEEDCMQDGSCTIDVQADGGMADCNASGGEQNKAGNGSGKKSGDGGTCDAVADGGAVSIGDINP